MGKTTCQGYPALGAKTVDDMGYARKDAATFVSWCSPRTINQHTSLFKPLLIQLPPLVLLGALHRNPKNQHISPSLPVYTRLVT